MDIDDVEITIRCQLENILAHLGMEEGFPGISRIDIKCFITSMDDPKRIKDIWDQTVNRSPIYATLAKSTEINMKVSIV